jgi:outer membrane protein insertion porin family
MRIQKLLSFIIFLFISSNLFAQFPLGVGRKFDQTKETIVSYERPKEYIISKITVSGVKFLDPNTLVSVSGLNVNDKISIPG